jgi:ankyrin repeat protein
MHWRRTSGLALLALSLTVAASASPGRASASRRAAERAKVADAAERRDTALVRTLIAAKADVNAAQIDGTTALHWAAYNDDPEMATLLVRSGANVNAVNRYGVPPLSLACATGHAGVVNVLLAAGADANATLKGGETVLMVAARSGNLEAVKALLARGARHDARERHGQTALMWAAAEGHAAVVRALIDIGADVSATLDSGFTPFFFAVREGHIDVVRALLDAGVDVNAPLQRPERAPGRPVNIPPYKPAARGTSPLLMAVQNGHFELAIALVERGADPNDRRTGFTPLHTITWVRKPDSSDGSEPAPIGSGSLTSLQFVREIVKRGANVNLQLAKGTPNVPNTSSRIDAEGATPFLLAADRSDIPLMRLLLELGADPLLTNFTRTTPLMAAAGLGTTEPLEEAGEETEALEAVKMLLERGADINAVDDNGDTAMHGAAYGNYPLVVQLLADRGANPQIWKERNKFGRTPLFIAEGYHGRLLRPDRPTIDVVTRLMRAAGLSTEGERPVLVDIYEKPPAPPKPPKPEKP